MPVCSLVTSLSTELDVLAVHRGAGQTFGVAAVEVEPADDEVGALAVEPEAADQAGGLPRIGAQRDRLGGGAAGGQLDRAAVVAAAQTGGLTRIEPAHQALDGGAVGGRGDLVADGSGGRPLGLVAVAAAAGERGDDERKQGWGRPTHAGDGS